MTTTATEAEYLAEQLIAKGRGWRSREMIVALREPEEGEAQDDRIPVRLSSEREVHRYDWWEDESYIEVLDHGAVDLSYARDGLPFCLDHWTAKQVGLIEDVRVVGKELHGMVRQGSHPDAEWAFKDIRNGIRKKVSIGYLQLSYKVANPKRKAGELEIRRYGFMVLEGSTVCIPADYEVGFGRGLLRALRLGGTNSPETAPSGQERTMKTDAAIAAPPAEAEGEERANTEQLRVRLLDGLESLGASDAQIRKWITSGASVKDAKEELKRAADTAAEEFNTRTRVATAGAPDVFVRSPKGEIGRDGNVKTDADTGGFDSEGEFWRAIANAGMPGSRVDRRLLRDVTGQSTGVSSEGGFGVPTAIVTATTANMFENGRIMSRVNRIPATAPSVKLMRVDEVSRVDGQRGGGVVSYWVGEGGAAEAIAKVKWREHLLDKKKIIAIARATEELLEDAPSMVSEVQTKIGEELEFRFEKAIATGNGNGQPIGFMGHPAQVAVAIESGQNIANTNTHIAANVATMMSRVPESLWNSIVFLANQSLFPKIITATLGNQPLYLPGGLGGRPYDTLLGRPLIFTEFQEAVGTVGDFVCAALSQYDVLYGNGPKASVSAHVRFDYDEMSFKWTDRIDGQLSWRKAITPHKGSDTLTPVVALAARS
jgi:HK97 family phage major capsid protein